MSNVNVIGDEWGTQQFEGFQKEDLADLTLKLLPVGRIEGRIMADQPELFRNISIAIETSEPTADSPRCTGQAMIQVGQDGRFVIPHIAAGMVDMYVEHRQSIAGPVALAGSKLVGSGVRQNHASRNPV